MINNLCTLSQMSTNTRRLLGVEWNSQHDHSRLVITKLPPQKDLTKRNLDVWHCESFWCFGLDCSSHCTCESENNAAMFVGRMSPMGQTCARIYTSDVEVRATASYGKAHSVLLLPQKRQHCIQATAWFLRCFWASIFWGSLPSPMVNTTGQVHIYIARCSKN